MFGAVTSPSPARQRPSSPVILLVGLTNSLVLDFPPLLCDSSRLGHFWPVFQLECMVLDYFGRSFDGLLPPPTVHSRRVSKPHTVIYCWAASHCCPQPNSSPLPATMLVVDPTVANIIRTPVINCRFGVHPSFPGCSSQLRIQRGHPGIDWAQY